MYRAKSSLARDQVGGVERVGWPAASTSTLPSVEAKAVGVLWGAC